jgi:hypothetical protein
MATNSAALGYRSDQPVPGFQDDTVFPLERKAFKEQGGGTAAGNESNM